MHEPNLSAMKPRGRGRVKLAASALALTLGMFGATLAATVGVASAQTATNDFAIGTLQGAVTNLSVVASPNTVGSAALYEVTFDVPFAMMQTGSTINTVTISDNDAGDIINSNVQASPTATVCPNSYVAVTDLTAGTTYGVQCDLGTKLANGTALTLPGTAGTNAIGSGNEIELLFDATNPSTAGTYSFTVTVESNSNGTTSTSTAATASFTIGGTAAPSLGVTATPLGFGQNASYTLSNVAVAGISPGNAESYLNLVAEESATTEAGNTTPDGAPSTGLMLWSPSTSYTITDKTASGTTETITASFVAANNDVPAADCPALTGASTTDPCSIATLSLSTSVANGDTLTIVGSGTNPTINPTTNVFGVQTADSAGTCGAAATTAEPYSCYDSATPTAGDVEGTVGNTTVTAPASTGTVVTVGSVTYGTEVSDVTVTPSPATAGSASTYVVSFKATSAMTTGGDILLTAPYSLSSVSGYVVTDTTQGTYVSSSTAPALSTVGTVTDDTVTVPFPDEVKAGDMITVTLTNVTNPTAGTYTTFDASTTADTVPAAATSYVIGPTAGGISVVPSPSTTGSLSTYTISGMTASANMGGSTGATINIDAAACTTCAGLVFPEAVSDYTITDATNASGTGTPATVTGGGTNDVTITPSNNITSGDSLTLTITGVINPSSASTTDTLDITGVNAVIVAVPTFPDAATTYPNAGIIDFAGTYYVFAGGHAFGFATVKQLTNVQTVDHATVQTAATGVTVPVTPPRVGTLINVYGNSTIYVVGSDGDLHGFASPTQLLQGGFDGADVITVPNMGGLQLSSTTVGGLGTGGTALALTSDGAVVNDSGTFYVFAGGRAFGVPTPAALTAILTGNPYSTPQTGTVASTATTTPIANGVIVTIKGTVYVSSAGELWPFKSMTHLDADGYGGTPSIIVPGAGGLTLVSTYTGS